MLTVMRAIPKDCPDSGLPDSGLYGIHRILDPGSWPRFANVRNDFTNRVKILDLGAFGPGSGVKFRRGSRCDSQIGWKAHFCKVLPGRLKTHSMDPLSPTCAMWILDPESWIQDPGPWNILEPGSWMHHPGVCTNSPGPQPPTHPLKQPG